MNSHLLNYSLSNVQGKYSLRNYAVMGLYAPTRNTKRLTTDSVNRYINTALAKSSASDWRRYIIVAKARHCIKSVLFLCLKNSFQLYGGLYGGLTSAISMSSTPTRAVCHPYWREGGRFNKLIIGNIMSNQLRFPNTEIKPIAVINGKITLYIRLKLWLKGVRYA